MSPIFQIINYSSNAAYATITKKYVNTSGTSIATSTTENVIIGSTYTVPTAPTLSGYQFKEQTHSNTITVNGNITITYKYLTEYTVTLKYLTTTGGTAQASSYKTVLEGNSYTVPTAPTIANHAYQSCDYEEESSITVNSNITITYTYKATILYLFDADQGGSVNEDVTGGWSNSVINHNDSYNYNNTLDGSVNSSRVKASTSEYYSCGSISTKNKIDLTNYSTLYFNITDYDPYKGNREHDIVFGGTTYAGNYSSSNPVLSTITSTGLYSINVSGFSGSYYIYLFACTTQTDTVSVSANKVYLVP